MKYRCGVCDKLGHNSRTCTKATSRAARSSRVSGSKSRPSLTKPKTSSKTSSNSRDLRLIFDELNEQYFNNQLKASIRWGPRIATSRWGYYQRHINRITINPALGLKECPIECLETTIYHEMLHEAIPTTFDDEADCRIVHGAEFRYREQLHPDYEFAKNWLKQNGTRLVRPESEQVQNFQGLRIGDKFTSRGVPFTITSFHPRKWKFPIIAQNARGTRYKFPLEQVLNNRINPDICIDDYDRPGFNFDSLRHRYNPENICEDDYDRPGFSFDVID